MKKRIIIFILLFLLTACSKNEFTKEDFLEKAEFNGYVIEESMDNYQGYNYIKNVHYAVNREGMYFIQLLEISNDDYAKRFYEYNMEEFIKRKTSNSYIKKINSTDYNVYHLETDSSYMLIVRYKNNIIYVDAPIGYINEIEEFLNELEINY